MENRRKSANRAQFTPVSSWRLCRGAFRTRSTWRCRREPSSPRPWGSHRHRYPICVHQILKWQYLLFNWNMKKDWNIIPNNILGSAYFFPVFILLLLLALFYYLFLLILVCLVYFPIRRWKSGFKTKGLSWRRSWRMEICLPRSTAPVPVTRWRVTPLSLRLCGTHRLLPDLTTKPKISTQPPRRFWKTPALGFPPPAARWIPISRLPIPYSTLWFSDQERCTEICVNTRLYRTDV